ncbi:MAG: ABC transporter permease [Butyrivibrio sp.]|uniref:ABC transporter permease n=1 Tax=Butyrivibrio sp. TaxID=28121 RepID=UPI001B276C2F|nr:ABC transporter permease [Butyrivibrio sp.]MBO6242925.1 ABC transporter permease [Butyrivibrio sp.]
MGTFGEYIKSAFSSIKNNKGRSFLTMLGIIIGIAAVLTVLIIGDGMKATVNSEMDSIGATTISVSLDNTKTDKLFTKDDLEEIEAAIDNIYGVSPSISVWGETQVRGEKYDMDISGGSQAMEHGSGVKMVHGRYFSASDVEDGKKVCVLSQIAAKKLFGYENAVGETVTITAYDLTADFQVIGIREDTSMDEAYASYMEEPAYMGDVPYTAAAGAFSLNIDNMSSFTIYLESENKNAVLSKARSVVENVMGLRGEGAVKISSGYGFDQTTDTILTIITSVVAIIAAISLLVGGIGVMNIMTVSVTERTREIGIRKSLGARTSSILTQFLAEAAILTFTGGIIGIILGISLSYLICRIIDFSFTVNPMLVALVVAISTGIGLFFGIYPARRAAKLDPIEALRTE